MTAATSKWWATHRKGQELRLQEWKYLPYYYAEAEYASLFIQRFDRTPLPIALPYTDVYSLA